MLNPLFLRNANCISKLQIVMHFDDSTRVPRVESLRVTKRCRIKRGVGGPRSGPTPLLFLPPDRHPSLAQQARCEGPIRRTFLTLCTKRFVCILFSVSPNPELP
jgi:hypothetical protein